VESNGVKRDLLQWSQKRDLLQWYRETDIPERRVSHHGGPLVLNLLLLLLSLSLSFIIIIIIIIIIVVGPSYSAYVKLINDQGS
jgi:hypothetical protein